MPVGVFGRSNVEARLLTSRRSCRLSLTHGVTDGYERASGGTRPLVILLEKEPKRVQEARFLLDRKDKSRYAQYPQSKSSPTLLAQLLSALRGRRRVAIWGASPIVSDACESECSPSEN